MNANQSNKRQFIKNIVLMSLFIGSNPLKLLSTGYSATDEDVKFFIEEANLEYQKFLRQLSNFDKISNLTENESKRQYIGLIKILSETSNPNFKNYSQEKKIRKLKNLDPFKPGTEIKKKDYQRILKEFQASSTIVFDASAFAYISSTALIGSAMKITNLINPAYKTALSIPRWLKVSNAIFGGAIGIRRGWKELEFRMKNSSIKTVEVLKTDVYDKFLNSTDFKFETGIKDFYLNVSNDNLESSQLFNNANFNDSNEKDFFSWLRNELDTKNIFSNKANLEIFLTDYINKIGKIQITSIGKVMEARKKNDEKTLIREREHTALYQSIQNFIGTVILNNVAAPKEAAILNTLINAGFQLAIAGTMGPIAIAAVGINIATNLLSNQNNQSFEKALFNAIQQIQKQLSVIIEKIDVLYKNQIEIIVQLNQILSKLDNIEDIITDEFAQISLQQNLIYNTILATQQQKLENKYNKVINDLSDAFKNNDSDEMYSNIQQLRGIITQNLNDKEMTKFTNSDYKGTLIKQEVYVNNKFRYNASLYDSIGLLSALHSYNSTFDNGRNETAIVHPIEFLSAVSTTINWIVLANFSEDKNTNLISPIKEIALESKKAINKFANKNIIEEKAKDFLSESNIFLFEIQKFLKNLERIDFTLQNNLISKFKLMSSTKIDLSRFLDTSIQNNDNPINFYIDSNDSSVFNLMTDMEILEISRISKVEFIGKYEIASGANYEILHPENLLKNHLVGSLVGSKNNKLIFRKALVNFEKRLYLDLEIPYTRILKMKSFSHTFKEIFYGHGEYSRYNYWRNVTDTYSETIIDSNWKTIITDEFNKQNYNVHDFFEKFNDLSFDDFLNHLVNNWFRQKKLEHITKLKQYFSDTKSSKFDGSGTALMVLSKLNQIIKNKNPLFEGLDAETDLFPLSYTIDYYDDIFIREDIEQFVYSIAITDFDKEGNEIYKELNKEYNDNNIAEIEKSIFYIKNNQGELEIKMNPESFSDLVIILLNQKTKKTAINCILKSQELTNEDCEPFLKDAINKLEWFISLS